MSEPQAAAPTTLQRALLDALAREAADRGALLRPLLGELLAGTSDVGAELRAVVEDMVRRGQDERELRREAPA